MFQSKWTLEVATALVADRDRITNAEITTPSHPYMNNLKDRDKIVICMRGLSITYLGKGNTDDLIT